MSIKEQIIFKLESAKQDMFELMAEDDNEVYDEALDEINLALLDLKETEIRKQFFKCKDKT